MNTLVLKKSKLYVNLLLFAFWLIGGVPFFGQELISGVYLKLVSPILLIADSILVFLGLCVLRNKIDKIMLFLFIIISLLSTCVFNGTQLILYINGIRPYISFLFILPIIRYFLDDSYRRISFIEIMDKTLYVFLILQLPCAIIQCIQYGAFDNVGGTLGWMQSGEMSTLVYLISLYFMHKKWDDSIGYLENIKRNLILIIALFPSFLNETKVSFIYLLLYFFFLLPLDKKMIGRVLILVPIVSVVMLLVGAFYLSIGGKGNTFSEEFITEYLFGNVDGRDYVEYLLDYGSDDDLVAEDDFGDLARGVKLLAIPVIWETKSYAMMTGFGLGNFKGGSNLQKTKFSEEYQWIITGTRMTFFMFAIELGLFGLIWFLIYWILVLKKWRNTTGGIIQVVIYQIILLLITGIYNAPFTNITFGIIFIYIMYVSLGKDIEENGIKE